MLKRYVVLPLVACALLGYGSVPSDAAVTTAPGWEVFGNINPTNLTPGSEERLTLFVYDVGGAGGEGAMLTDTLPEGVIATGGQERNGEGCAGIGTGVVTCPVTDPHKGAATEVGEIVPGERVEILIPIRVSESIALGNTADHVSIVGGGALHATEAQIPMTFSFTEAGLGFSDLDMWITNADGTSDTQAGSHPYSLTVAFGINSALLSEGAVPPAGGQARNIDVNLPPGIVGNPRAVPQCTRAQFDELYEGETYPGCPVDTQVGWDYTTLADFDVQFPVRAAIYNLVPPPGVAAQFAFELKHVPVFLDAGVRTGGDNGITEHAENLPERKIVSNSATIWGVPAEASHNDQREGYLPDGEYCGTNDEAKQPESCPSTAPGSPFLTLPTSCQGPQEVSGQLLGTWEDESVFSPITTTETQDAEGNPVGFTGCEKLVHFEPSAAIVPETTYADTPTGLSVVVRMPQGANPEELATSGLQDTEVTLPEGIVINPGQATGLQACQPSEEALGTEPDGVVNEGPPSCPSASKVGTVEIETPLLKDKLKGNVYILGSNPPDLQLLMAASGDGVNLKLVGNVHLNETTGQLVTTFEKTPDMPFTEFKLAFSGGAQAALATPTGCGTYASTADFTPWASPFIEDAISSSHFQINAGTDGTPCQNPLPFAPTMTAGATTDQAGGYTDFTMLLQRGDDQQRVKNLSFKTPNGLLGMIAKVPLCEEPQAAQGTCSPASQIGHTVVGTGPGPYPFYIPQASAPPAPIYLTGPYKGAPFGLSIVVPLIAGPFNLGTEIVRATIVVDSHTGQVTITTDPLPQVVKGIPADLRSIDAVIDRPEFMFNPTNCNPMSFTGTSTSIEGATAPLSSHFQVGSCQALKFQPDFKVSTSGKTSRADGASLNVKIVYPVGNLGYNQASSQSNIADVKVDLPKHLPSRLTTLQKACPAKTFEANPANCPPASIVGHTKAITPVLPVPLEGPAYFVSHAGEEFPSLIAVLQGDNVTVDLVGSTFIDSKTDITTSTFKEVPDVPIQSFELNLPQGKYSALAATGNLCKTKLEMPTAFIGQNGAEIHQSTPISVTGCPKAKVKKKAKTKKKTKAKAKKKK